MSQGKEGQQTRITLQELSSGHTLQTLEVPHTPPFIVYNVKTQEGLSAFSFKHSKENDSSNGFSVSWATDSTLPDFLTAANAYIQTNTTLDGDVPHTIAVQTHAEYPDGDIIEEAELLFPVETDAVLRLSEQHLGSFEDVDDISLRGPGETVIFSRNHIRIYPNILNDFSRQQRIETLYELFRQTTEDNTLIPVFQEAFDVFLSGFSPNV